VGAVKPDKPCVRRIRNMAQRAGSLLQTKFREGSYTSEFALQAIAGRGSIGSKNH